MSAATVLFVLKAGGDLAGKLPSMSAALRKVGEAALSARANVVALGSSARSGFNSLGEHAGQAAEGAAKAAAGFAALGFATHQVLKSNDEYEQSTARLVIASQKLGQRVADMFGPSVGKFIDSFTIGLTYIGTLVTGVVGPAFTTLAALVGKFTERAALSLEIWKRIFSGDFSGAKQILEGHQGAFREMLTMAKDGFAAIDAARDDAFSAAFAAWRKQVDGIKDRVGEIRKSYADIVTTISGTGGPTQAGFTAGPAPKMGTTVTEHIGQTIMPDDSGSKEIVSGVDQVTSAVEGVSGGVSGLLQMIPIYGKLLGGVWELAKNFSGISQGIVDELIGFITGLADQFVATITDLPMSIIDAFPDIITSILALIPKIILELIASGPKLMVAVVKAIIDLPKTIGREFRAMFEQFVLDIKEAFAELGSLFTGKEGKVLGTSFAGKKNHGDRSIFGLSLPKFDTGGEVTRSGLAFVDKGERVYTPQQQQQQGRGRVTSANVTVHMHGVQDMEAFVRELQAKLGSYGIGLTLDPRGPR